MSLTVGEHDSMWKDVMGRQIPNATEYMRILCNQQGYANDIAILKELYSIGVLSKKEYAITLVNVGNHTGLWTDEKEHDKYLVKAQDLEES